MTLNNSGKIAENVWLEVSEHLSRVKLVDFVVMLNHIHGIIWITDFNGGGEVDSMHCLIFFQKNKRPFFHEYFCVMKITFLGTGTSQGVPVVACNCVVCLSKDIKDKRLRVSLLIETRGKTIVIDTGPDFRQQMLRENVTDIDAVVYTHEHKDHMAGLDDVRAFNFKKEQKEIPLYGDERVCNAIKRDFYYAFTKKKISGVPLISMNEITNNSFHIGDISLQPVLGLHYKLPVFGYKIENFLYITDVKTIPEKELSKFQNLDVLVISALRKEKHISHFNLEEALAFVTSVKPKKTYLTHISHLMGTHEEVSQELPPNISMAYDTLQIQL